MGLMYDYMAALKAYKTNIWRRIEVVITGRTRNALALTGTWVRIPPSPPNKNRDFDTMGIEVTVLIYCLFYGAFQLF